MYIDIAVLIIVVVFILLGVKKGFIMEFFSFFGVLISIFLTKLVIDKFYNKLSIGEKELGNLRYIVAYIVIFLILYLALYIILLLTKKFFQFLFLGFVDRLLGGFVGFLKGSLISAIILTVVIVISNYSKNFEALAAGSHSVKLASNLSKTFSKIFPDIMENGMEKYKDKKNLSQILEEYLMNEKNIDKDKLQKVIKKMKKTGELEKLLDDGKDMLTIVEQIKKELINENNK